VNFGGGVALFQVDPPSLLKTNTGTEAPDPVAPAPMHDVADWHDTSKIEADPVGKVTVWKVDPPSVVSTALPDALELKRLSPLGPTATHVVVLAQLIENSCPMPPVAGTMFQFWPPSVLTRTFDPTAIHVFAVGQAISVTADTLFGIVA
jgi:hypothetical protein